MANAKRASMREGPLAALFRKTDEAAEARQDRRSPAAQRQPRRDEAGVRRTRP